MALSEAEIFCKCFYSLYLYKGYEHLFVVFRVAVTLVTFEKNLQNDVDGVNFVCLQFLGRGHISPC